MKAMADKYTIAEWNILCLDRPFMTTLLSDVKAADEMAKKTLERYSPRSRGRVVPKVAEVAKHE